MDFLYYNNTFKRNNKIILYSFFVFLIIVVFSLSPQVYMKETLSGLIVFGTKVFPALFPFFVFSKILTELGLVSKIANKLSGITQKLFNVSGISAYIYLISIISGYPVGAKLTSELYEKGYLSKNEIPRITAFTSTSGPLFIVGTVGMGMLGHPRLGFLILFCHYLSALINGLFYRKFHFEKSQNTKNCFKQTQPNINSVLANSVYSSVVAIAIVGAYISLFFLLIKMFNNLYLTLPLTFVLENIFKISAQDASSFVNGLIEMTNGCLGLTCGNLSLFVKTLLCGFIISFGGLCTAMQGYAFLHKCEIKFSVILLQKITQAFVTLALILLSYPIFF